jgi:hypothetical protein
MLAVCGQRVATLIESRHGHACPTDETVSLMCQQTSFFAVKKIAKRQSKAWLGTEK